MISLFSLVFRPVQRPATQLQEPNTVFNVFVVMPFIMVEHLQQIKRIVIWHAQGIRPRYVEQEADCPCILLELRKCTSRRALRKLDYQPIGLIKDVFSQSMQFLKHYEFIPS